MRICLYTVNDLEGYFKGLADVNRLRIINLLSYGELCGCDIQYVLDVSQTNVSRHLTYLRHVGLVAHRREGYRVFYRLAAARNDKLRGLFDFLRMTLKLDQTLQNDLARLKVAIKEGACTIGQIQTWPPAPARGAVAARPGGREARRGALRQFVPARR